MKGSVNALLKVAVRNIEPSTDVILFLLYFCSNRFQIYHLFYTRIMYCVMSCFAHKVSIGVVI